MKKNNYLIISSKFKPDIDGLSDHTYYFFKLLSKEHKVSLLTSKKYETEITTPNIYSKVKKWRFLELKRRFLEIKDINNIIIQYVPSLYADRGGINFSILFFFIYLRLFTKCKITFLYHELYYPFSFYWKNIILHISHKIMLFISINTSHQVFCSTEYFTQVAKNFLFVHSNISRLPIPSNIEEKNELVHTPREQNSYIIFGSPHPSKKYSEVLSCFEQAYNSGLNFQLTLIGPTLEKLMSQVSLPPNFQKFCKLIPNASEELVRKEFSKSQYLVAYFEDGVSARRSSVITALAMGLNIITNKTGKSDSILINKPFIHLLRTHISDFQDELIDFISEKREPIESTHVINFYNNECAWSLVLKQLSSVDN